MVLHIHVGGLAWQEHLLPGHLVHLVLAVHPLHVHVVLVLLHQLLHADNCLIIEHLDQIIDSACLFYPSHGQYGLGPCVQVVGDGHDGQLYPLGGGDVP